MSPNPATSAGTRKVPPPLPSMPLVPPRSWFRLQRSPPLRGPRGGHDRLASHASGRTPSRGGNTGRTSGAPREEGWPGQPSGDPAGAHRAANGPSGWAAGRGVARAAMNAVWCERDRDRAGRSAGAAVARTGGQRIHCGRVALGGLEGHCGRGMQVLALRPGAGRRGRPVARDRLDPLADGGGGCSGRCPRGSLCPRPAAASRRSRRTAPRLPWPRPVARCSGTRPQRARRPGSGRRRRV
jgi:hypothetical protein